MPSPSLESSLVRILTDDRTRRPVGAGFLVTPQHIITCVHVVNTASGRKQYVVDHPANESFLDFTHLDGHTLPQSPWLIID